jgi:hypothetical protein
VSSGVLIFLELNCFCFKKHKILKKYARPTGSYFSLPIFSNLGFRKTALFISVDAEFQALPNAVHHKR